MLALVTGLHEKNTAAALEAVQAAVQENVDMKLFTRVLLEHVRAVMLIRNMPNKKEELLSAFGSEARELVAQYAAEASPLNSHLLLRFLQAADMVSRSPIPQAPLEIAIIDVTKK